jgi:hypothetical protein
MTAPKIRLKFTLLRPSCMSQKMSLITSHNACSDFWGDALYASTQTGGSYQGEVRVSHKYAMLSKCRTSLRRPAQLGRRTIVVLFGTSQPSFSSRTRAGRLTQSSADHPVGHASRSQAQQLSIFRRGPAHRSDGVTICRGHFEDPGHAFYGIH